MLMYTILSEAKMNIDTLPPLYMLHPMNCTKEAVLQDLALYSSFVDAHVESMQGLTFQIYHEMSPFYRCAINGTPVLAEVISKDVCNYPSIVLALYVITVLI